MVGQAGGKEECALPISLSVCIFFFKQKTAYEIYQCDWSSDVCSSDLDHMILSEEMRGIRWAPTPEDITFDDYDQFLIKNNAWGWEKPPEIGYNEIKPLLNPLPQIGRASCRERV